MGCTHSGPTTDKKKGADLNKGAEMDKTNKNTKDTIEYRMYKITVEECNIQPHFYVLDIGYGSGHGLREVLKQIEGGSGRVIGTETSKSNIIKVNNELQHEISHGTLELTMCTPDNMPYITNMFECVYTVDGIYSWMDCDQTLLEIYRVLRPGCIFVTCLKDSGSTTKLVKKSPQSTVGDYIEKLNTAGFIKVKTQEHRDAVSGFRYYIIKAFTPSQKDEEI